MNDRSALMASFAHAPARQALDHEIVSGVSPAAEVVPVKRAKPVRRKPAAKSPSVGPATKKKRIRKHTGRKEVV